MSTLLWPRDHRAFWHSHHHLMPGMRHYNIGNFVCDVPYCYCHLYARREYSRLFMQRPPLQPRYPNSSSRSSKKFPFYITNSKTEDSPVLQDYADLRLIWSRLQFSRNVHILLHEKPTQPEAMRILKEETFDPHLEIVIQGHKPKDDPSITKIIYQNSQPSPDAPEDF